MKSNVLFAACGGLVLLLPTLVLGQQIAYPDMQVRVPTSEISIGHPTPSTRELRFTHITLNGGAGPLDIRPVYNSSTGISQGYQRLFTDSGTTLALVREVPIVLPMVFVPPDDYRFPFSQFGLYSDVNGAIGTLVAPSPKDLFCMTEDLFIGGLPNTPPTRGHPGSCTNPSTFLGISVGWADRYDYLDPGENINITNVPDGVYWLRAVADPYHYFQESDLSNNATDTQIRIAGDTVTILKQIKPNSTPPAVAITAPASGASVGGPVVLTANVTGNVQSVQFLVDGHALPETIAANPPQYSITWNTAGADGPHLLSAQATDTNGFINTAVAVPVTVSNTTASCPCTIWPATTAPAAADYPDASGVELGVKFRADVKGTVSGIRFYKSAANTGTHVVSLWTFGGGLLARATSSAPGSGWQQVNFDTPVTVEANTAYVASYHTTTGHYSVDTNYFAAKGFDRGPLHALKDGLSGVNGVYAYSTSSVFPVNGWRSNNYWVDVVFNSAAPPPPDTTPPVVTVLNPAPNQVLSGTVLVTARATDNIAVSSVQFSVDGTFLPGTVTASPPNYAIQWDTTRISSTTHTVSAVAKDTSNLSSTPASVNVSVNNPPLPKSCFIVDVTTFARGLNTVITPAFRTSLPGELLLAFIGADGPGTGGQTASVSGAGLTWTLVRRANAQLGVSEVWQARAPTAIVNAAVTARAIKTGFDVSLYVVAIQGTAGVGTSAAASGIGLAPSVTLQTTKAGSLIYGVGNDYDNATARVVGTNQILDYQWLDTGTGDAYWVQNETYPPLLPLGAFVTLNNTTPTSDRWNFVAVEILGEVEP